MQLGLALALIAVIALPAQALIEPSKRNGTVAAKAFVDPDLSRDVVSDEVNLLDPAEYTIPSGFYQTMNELEARLGVDANSISTHVDLRSGRVDLLTVAVPILPGDGIGNRLLWSVKEKDSTVHSSPVNVEEWQNLAVQGVKNWMLDYASLLDVNVDDELFATSDSVRTTVHGDGDMIQLHIPRTFKGIPVEGSRAMATIKLGNLIHVGFEDWGSIPKELDVLPTITVDDAYDIVAGHAGSSLVRGEVHCDAELKILTMTPSSANGQFGKGYEYVLVWRVCPMFESQDVEAMEGLVDAHNGKIYSFTDRVHYFEAKGGVYPISNDGRNPDGQMQSGWPMPYMSVGGTTTDTGGNYFGSGGSASFQGPFVRVVDNCGSASLSHSSGLDWGGGGGTNCATPGFGGSGNTHSSRTNFYELNKVIEMARSHLPNNSWLKKKLQANVNINNSCNAWWLNTINFYREGNGCGNTGELAGVIAHEWGHGLDNNDNNGQIAKPSGEGIADLYAALRMDDSCIGRGFFQSGGGCTGVRQIDFKLKDSGKPITFTIANRDCNGRVHCLGNVYAEAIWSLYERQLKDWYGYDRNTALEVVTRLTYIAADSVSTWYKGSPPEGGCASGTGYQAFIAADDDNGNLNDGTPHMRAIFQAFNDQEIACSTPNVKDSGCSGTPNTAPFVTVSPSNMGAYISWTYVPGASMYQVFRTEGVKKCEQGKVLLTSTTSLSFTDSGLMNGRVYYYIVIPKGPNDSCFGPSSACITVKPAETPLPTRKPSPPTTSPTSRPTQRCGDSICQIDEDLTSCPVDCFGRELNALDDTGRHAPGIMLTLESRSRDIDISAFEFFTTEQSSSNLVEIWTRPGPYSGYETDASGWQFVYQANVALNGPNTLTILELWNKITIPSGASRSFFIWINGANLRYKEGMFSGAVVDFDAYALVYDGVGITGKWSGSYTDVYSPRSFVGLISYDVLPLPTGRPTSPPTNRPTMLPTSAPKTTSPTMFSCPLIMSEDECVANSRCSWRPVIGRCARYRLTKTSKRTSNLFFEDAA